MATNPQLAQKILDDIAGSEPPSKSHCPSVSVEELSTPDWIPAVALGKLLGKNGLDSLVAHSALREITSISPTTPETIAMLNARLGDDGIVKKVAFVDTYRTNTVGRMERVGNPYVKVDIERLKKITARGHETTPMGL